MMRSLSVNTAATSYPVTLDEAMTHCRVTDSDEAAYLTDCIGKATHYCETYLQRRFITTELRLTLDEFPGGESDEILEIPEPPFKALKSIRYYATSGTQTTLCTTASSTAVQIDSYSEPARIKPAYGTVWPATRDQLNAVTVIYTAGYSTAAADIPLEIKHGILLVVGHLYEHRGESDEKLASAVENLLNVKTYNRVYVRP